MENEGLIILLHSEGHLCLVGGDPSLREHLRQFLGFRFSRVISSMLEWGWVDVTDQCSDHPSHQDSKVQEYEKCFLRREPSWLEEMSASEDIKSALQRLAGIAHAGNPLTYHEAVEVMIMVQEYTMDRNEAEEFIQTVLLADFTLETTNIQGKDAFFLRA